jgi:hypothetical protein
MNISSIFSNNASIKIKALRTAALLCGLAYGTSLAFDLLPERKYTAQQQEKLDNIFHDSLDVDAIHYKVSAISDFLIESNHSDAYTLGDTIHFHSRFYNAETDPFQIGSWVFLHEHVHVWHNQNCAVREHTIFNAIADGLSGEKHNEAMPYTYTLDAKKDLSDYNHEQQASIIADYYRINDGQHPVYLDPNQDYKRDAHLYGKVLKHFLNEPSYIQNHCQNIPYAEPRLNG